MLHVYLSHNYKFHRFEWSECNDPYQAVNSRKISSVLAQQKSWFLSNCEAPEMLWEPISVLGRMIFPGNQCSNNIQLRLSHSCVWQDHTEQQGCSSACLGVILINGPLRFISFLILFWKCIRAVTCSVSLERGSQTSLTRSDLISSL